MYIDVLDDYVKGTIRQRAKNWCEDETDLLLDLWGSDKILEELGRSKHNHDAIFKQMAATLQSHGFFRSDIEVRNRMRYLRDYFKRMAKQSTTQQKEDRYYTKLSKIIGYRQQRLAMMQQDDDANNNVIKTASPNSEEGGPVLNSDFNNFNFPTTLPPGVLPPGLMLPSFLQGLRTSLENGARLHGAGQFLFPGLLHHHHAAPLVSGVGQPQRNQTMDPAQLSRPESVTPPATPLMTTLADLNRLANHHRPLLSSTTGVPQTTGSSVYSSEMVSTTNHINNTNNKTPHFHDISPPPPPVVKVEGSQQIMMPIVSEDELRCDTTQSVPRTPETPNSLRNQKTRKRPFRCLVISKSRSRESGVIRAINRLSRRISKLERRRILYEERMEERRMHHERTMVDAMRALMDKVTGPAA